MHFIVSHQESFPFLRLSNGKWDLKLDITFNKILKLNTIYGETSRFFNAPDVKLLMIKH
jgi:hypothetical protein